MNEVTPQQIRDAILQGLEDVRWWFARHPQATDGTIKSALVIAAAGQRRREAARKKRARRGKTR
jgi:hypothetical protein